MATYYCPRCWHEVGGEIPVCPHCGAEIAEVLERRDYTAKLIAALSHPEPTTPLRAIWVLGKLRAVKAAEPLMHLLQGKADPYTKAAAVEALGLIGAPGARPILTELAENGPVLLRDKAAEALRRLDANSC